MDERPPPPWTPTKADIALVWSLVRQKLPRLDARIHEEIVQQVLIARTRGQASPAEPQAYLNGIVRNVVRDFWRDERKSRQTMELLSEEPMDGEAVGADEAIDRIERRRMVQECLQSVPELFRAVVFRFDLEEKPIEEVKAELGICAGTAYSRLRRGRARLAEAVHRYLARRKMSKDDLLVPVMAFVSMDTGSGEALPPASPPPPWHVRFGGWLGDVWPWAATGTVAAFAVIALALLPAPGGAVTIAAEAWAPAAPAKLAALATSPASEGGGAPSSPPIGSIAPVAVAAAPMAVAAAPTARPEWEWAQSIAVLARRGNFAAASASAAAFRKSYPRSMHLPFVNESLRAAELRSGPKGGNTAVATKR